MFPSLKLQSAFDLKGRWNILTGHFRRTRSTVQLRPTSTNKENCCISLDRFCSMKREVQRLWDLCRQRLTCRRYLGIISTLSATYSSGNSAGCKRQQSICCVIEHVVDVLKQP
jgi:hypothetical protein